MTERLPITNLLLLLILATFLLISGSLQSAFDCLTQVNHPRSAAVRVDDCHSTEQLPAPVTSCANKACHQGSPQHHDLDGPQLFSLNSLTQPISSSSRLQMPVLRAGSPLPITPTPQPILLAGNTQISLVPSQQQRSIRTTVLLN